MKHLDYGIAFLLRKTSLSLEEIKGLNPSQFREIFSEVAYQEEVESYQRASYVANILAAIANTISRRTGKTYRAADFLSMKEPRRTGPNAPASAKEEIEKLAKRFNIKLPAREILDL